MVMTASRITSSSILSILNTCIYVVKDLVYMFNYVVINYLKLIKFFCTCDSFLEKIVELNLVESRGKLFLHLV